MKDNDVPWVSVFSRDAMLDETWGFLYFAHTGCAEDYASEETRVDREFALVVTPKVATDGECEFCSDVPHEERVTRRQRMFDTKEIPFPEAPSV